MSITRTNISTEQQISFANSPIYVRVMNNLQNNTLQAVTLKLWIWNGAQNKTLGSPNFTFFTNKISVDDTYILFEISQYIKAFLIRPSNATNTNQPQFYYNELTNPSITGQGVFWQVEAEIVSIGGTVTRSYNTNFATLGWRWNYEQNSIGNNGTSPNRGNGFDLPVRKWYNNKIHNYISQSFNLTNPYTTATTANMITRVDVTPDAYLTKDCRHGVAIVFLNKLGLFEFFTPIGKFAQSVKVKSENNPNSFRDAPNVDNSYVHSKSNKITEVTNMYSINTGALYEDMTELVEQIIYSPKVYLIKFKGDYQPVTTVGITIDSTAVTIDDTNITIDSFSTTEEFIGMYKTHQQIPVICTDNDFQYKTIYNNKTSIDYTMKFEDTTNKIL